MKFRARRVEEPEVNLISLIDVVLMIVIFFMLSSTFTQEGRLKIRLPEAGAAAVPRSAQQPIVVAVSAEGTFQVDGATLADARSETLRSALTAVAGTSREARVMVRADARATHQSVVTVMDVIGRLGFREVDIATLQEPPSGAPAAKPESGRTARP